MKKIDIIKKSDTFTEIIKKGSKIKNKYYSVYFRTLNNTNKYGISIPKKIGIAVVRNKVKRQVKNIIDNNKNDIKNGYEYVIIVKEAFLSLDYAEREKELLKLLKDRRTL